MTFAAELNSTTACTDAWPAEVELILSALAAGEDRALVGATSTRRRRPRVSYRVLASLNLFSDPPDAGPWPLYTRDAGPRGLGFITPHRLTLGHGGTVGLMAPDGRVLDVNCTLVRCREVASGWFDGALHFNREQAAFSVR